MPRDGPVRPSLTRWKLGLREISCRRTRNSSLFMKRVANCNVLADAAFLNIARMGFPAFHLIVRSSDIAHQADTGTEGLEVRPARLSELPLRA